MVSLRLLDVPMVRVDVDSAPEWTRWGQRASEIQKDDRIKVPFSYSPSPHPFTTHSYPTPSPPLMALTLICFCAQNLTNEEQVVVIQARTVLTLAEKVTGTLWISGRGPGSCR